MLDGLPSDIVGEGNFDPNTAIEEPKLIAITATMIPPIITMIDEQKFKEKNVLNVLNADFSPSSVRYSLILE